MKKKIKIVFLLLTTLALFFVVKSQIERDRIDILLIKLGLLKKSYSPGKDFIEVFSQEGLDYVEVDKKNVKESLKKISDLNVISHTSQTKIPLITHNIYFFLPNNPSKLADYYIENLKTNFDRFSKINDNWKHYIWTNMPEMFPEEIKNIKNVEVRLADEFSSHKLYNPMQKNIQENFVLYLAKAADLMRLITVEKYGGIYMDLDYQIYSPDILYESMKRFNFIIGREHTRDHSYYGNAFFAASATHPVIKEAVQMEYRNIFKPKDIKIPDYVMYPRQEDNIMYFNSPPLITIAYFKKNNIEGNNDVVMPSWMLYNVGFIRFQYKTCNLKEIKKDALLENNKNFPVIFNEYINQIKDEEIISSEYDNIYYTNKYRLKYPVIGADMFCGTWSFPDKRSKKVYYYWKISF